MRTTRAQVFGPWMGWQTDAKTGGDTSLGQDGKPQQGLSGVVSLRFPQHPPGGICPPPLEFPKLPGTFQTSVRRRQAMTHSQVLFFPFGLLRGWLQIASCNQAPSLHTGKPKQTPELMEALENVVSRLALSAPHTRHRRRFGPCASFQHHQYWPFLSLMRRDSGKEVCSLLLLCEPSRGKRHSGFTCRTFHLDIAGKWECWTGGFYCSLHSGKGFCHKAEERPRWKSAALWVFFRPQSADQIMSAQQWQVQSPLLRDQDKKNLVPMNQNVCPYLHCPCPKVSVGSLERGCFSKFLFLESDNCNRGFNFGVIFCCYMWGKKSYVMSWKHKTTTKTTSLT